MPTKTKIEWADYVSNPIRAFVSPGGKDGHACIKISEGCTHCWASAMNVRLGTGLEYNVQNLHKVTTYIKLRELEALRKFNPRGPFKNGRERAMVFVCDMTDLFGTWVDADHIHAILNAMAHNQNIDFVILTKRLALAQAALERWLKIYVHAPNNIIIGVSVENNTRAKELLPVMKTIHEMGWKTMVSHEPSLEAVDWTGWEFLNWLICGGESGPNARPMPINAARRAWYFCQFFNIPFFFKQWGEWNLALDLAEKGCVTIKNKSVRIDGEMMVKVGKGIAGHLLDGVEWRQMP
jgi:protein gp37